MPNVPKSARYADSFTESYAKLGRHAKKAQKAITWRAERTKSSGCTTDESDAISIKQWTMDVSSEAETEGGSHIIFIINGRTGAMAKLCNCASTHSKFLRR